MTLYSKKVLTMKSIKSILARSTVSNEAEINYSCTEIIDHSNDEAPKTSDIIEVPEGTELPHEVYSVTDDLDPRAYLDGEEIIEPALEPIDTYIDVSGVVEETLQEGGLSLEAAQLLNLFNQFNGIKTPIKISMESTGTTALYETKVALEGIKEFIAEWWARFKEWLEEAKKKLEEWAADIMVKITNLKEKGENLINAVTHATPGDGNVKVLKKNLLSINGSVSNVPESLGVIANFAESQYTKVITAGFDTANSLSNALSGTEITSEEDVNTLIQKLANGLKMPWESYSEVLTQSIDNAEVTEFILKGNKDLQARTFSSPKLLGDALIIGTEFALSPKGDGITVLKNLSEALKYSKVEILFDDGGEIQKWSPSVGKEENSEDDELPRLSPNDVRSIGESLVKLGTALERNKDVMSQKRSADQHLYQAGQMIDGMTISEELADGKSVASSLRSIIASTASLIQSPVMKVTMYLIYVGQAAAEYASKSIGANHVETPNNETE